MFKALRSLTCLTVVIHHFWAIDAIAQVDSRVHQQCLKASDYRGCVETFKGEKGGNQQQSGLEQLRSALRLLPSRLENTNLRDFTLNTQIFYDAIGGIDPETLKSDYEKEFYQEATAIRGMTSALQAAWSERIREGTIYGRYGDSYNCLVLQGGVSRFNAAAGSRYSVSYNGTTRSGMFMPIESCSPQELDMVRAISRRVSEALVDPKVREAELVRQRREEELSRLAPWQRYLEENPQIKRWAEANPAQAEKAREKFLSNLNRQR